MKKWSYLLGLLILLEIMSAALYLGKAGQFGFPLDDAWIHQTYARNLGLHGVMAFSPGRPSTGSTSFGWTVLLAAGYWLKVPFFFWTYLWGGIFTIATAFLAACLSQNYFGHFRNAVIVAVICILEWHLAWAAESGMEVGLFTFLTLLFLLIINRDGSPLLLGALSGIIILVRPEGMILALLYGFKLILTQQRKIARILIDGAVFLLTLSVIVSPWIVFNLTYSHRPFPSTVTAKFLAYGYPWSLWKSIQFLWGVFIYFLNGPLLLIIPGAAFVIYNTVRTKDTRLFYSLAWFFTIIVLYAIALPVLIDHGRYIMPLIPLAIIYGIEGFKRLLEKFFDASLLRIIVWIFLFGMIFLLWINGATDFAYRIRILDTVHMQAAQWINANTSQDTVLATHDIGIIGYHTERQIVDLAGLVTPDFPIMEDAQQMANYVRAKQVTYLIVYSGYYRDLLDILDAQLVFSPGADQLRVMGVEPFEVYEISK